MGVLTETSVYGVIGASNPTFRNPKDKIAFAVHACFMASGFHLHATGSYEHVTTVLNSSSTEEVGIDNWNQGTNHYGFVYSDPELSMKKIAVTILTVGDELMVSVFRDGDSVLTDFDIRVSDYVLDTEENNRYFKNFGKLVADIEKELVNKYAGSSAAATTATRSGEKDLSRDEDQRDSPRISEGARDAEHATPETTETSEREHTDPESEPEPEPDFKVEERVLVYFHQTLYPAKVCHVIVYVDSPVLWRYYISYDGWGKVWEEWASHMRILKANNTPTMRAQRAALRRLPAGSKTKIWRPPERDKQNKVNGRWVDDIYQEKINIDTELGFSLPELLFVRMIEDRDLCVHGGLVLVLPHPCTIETIVQRFIAYTRDLQKPRIREKVLNKWITVFNEKTSDFLYEPEEDASRSVESSGDSPHLADRLPSELYGVEHLVRLLVRLPRSLLKYRGSKKG